MNRKWLESGLVLWLVASLLGCGGSGSAPPPPPPPPPQISVSVSPATANVAAGGSQQFNASVTGSSNTAVIWQVNGVAGGNSSVGTVSATGLYTAPTSAGATVVSAAAQANQSDSGKANVVVLSPHIFGIRTTSTLSEFYDRTLDTHSPRVATTTFAWPPKSTPTAIRLTTTLHSMLTCTTQLAPKPRSLPCKRMDTTWPACF